ncbi:MAG: ArsB/NhaD family transporter [Acidimicrobiales bacterium]
MLALFLLVVGVSGAIARPRRIPAWVGPTAAAVVAVSVGAAPHPAQLLRPLATPIAFLLVAVPLAALLEEVGFFAAAGGLVGRGRHVPLGLWVLGALVTTVLNLDASVVLLTPLYVRIARRGGVDPLALAFQPVLLSCLASSALPVSNLTNLIVASSRHLHAIDFLAHLGLPSLAATIVGWFAYRTVVRPDFPADVDPDPPDAHALRVGGMVVGALLIGFVVGPGLGVPEWAVALAADLILIGVTRLLPLRAIPWGTALVAASLGILAGGAASHLRLDSVLSGSGNLDYVRITALAAGGANVINNLPALLVTLPHTGPGIWALLLGVNVGPLVLVTGSLAALLWQASLGGLGIEVTPRQYASVGVRVGLPSLSAAFVVLVLIRPLVGG